MPLPRVPDDDLQVGVLRAPAQLALRAVTGCIEYRRISRPARRRLPGHRRGRPPGSTVSITDLTECGVPVPTLNAPDGAPALEGLERADVGVGEVADVDVVAQAGAVGRRIVLAEHLQRRAAGGGANRQRDEVNLVGVILADRCRPDARRRR